LELVWWGKGKKAQLRMVLCDGGTNPFMTNHYMFTRGSSKPLVVATRTALIERLFRKIPSVTHKSYASVQYWLKTKRRKLEASFHQSLRRSGATGGCSPG